MWNLPSNLIWAMVILLVGVMVVVGAGLYYAYTLDDSADES